MATVSRAEAAFQDLGGEVGDGTFARESCSEVYFSVESSLTGLTPGPARCTLAVGPGVKPVMKPGC